MSGIVANTDIDGSKVYLSTEQGQIFRQHSNFSFCIYNHKGLIHWNWQNHNFFPALHIEKIKFANELFDSQTALAISPSEANTVSFSPPKN